MTTENLLEEIHEYMLDHEETTRNDFKVTGKTTVITITQTNGEVHEVLIDTEDYHRMGKGSKWFVIKNSRSNNLLYVYRNIWVDGKRTLEALHRFVTNAPKGMVVDHIHHDTLDNRKANLKVCTHAENMRNRKNKTTHKTK
jgi:hypothetical protein